MAESLIIYAYFAHTTIINYVLSTQHNIIPCKYGKTVLYNMFPCKYERSIHCMTSYLKTLHKYGRYCTSTIPIPVLTTTTIVSCYTEQID